MENKGLLNEVKVEFNLSIVIVYAYGIDMLLNCLDSIYKTAKGIKFEIIVVCNNPPEEDINFIKNRYHGIKTIILTSSVGFSKASNLGFSQVKGDYFLWLNSDTLLEPDAINLMLSYLEDHPNICGVGPMVISCDGKFQSCFSDNFKTLPTQFIDYLFLNRVFPKLSVKQNCKGKENIPHKTNVLSGACIMLRREILEEVGLLDENYYFYMEEFDWCLRIRKAGHNLFYLPQARIRHVGGGALKMLNEDIQNKFRLLGIKGEFYYFMKHFGKKSEIIFTMIFFTSSVIRLIVYFLLYQITFLNKTSHTKFNKLLIYCIENIQLCLKDDRADATKL